MNNLDVKDVVTTLKDVRSNLYYLYTVTPNPDKATMLYDQWEQLGDVLKIIEKSGNQWFTDITRRY